MKRVFNDTPRHAAHDVSICSDVVMNEVLWQCAKLRYDRLLQLVNSFELIVVVKLLIEGCVKWLDPPMAVRLTEADILTPQVG